MCAKKHAPNARIRVYKRTATVYINNARVSYKIGAYCKK